MSVGNKKREIKRRLPTGINGYREKDKCMNVSSKQRDWYKWMEICG